MARYRLTLTVEGANIKQVAAKLRKAFGKDADTESVRSQIAKIERNPSRADRLVEIQNEIQTLNGDIEGLKEELEEWKDSLPENLQSGSKADELDEAISQLSDLYDDIDRLDFESVSFPSMMG